MSIWRLPRVLQPKARSKVAFIHIPKCAGSSINWHLKKHLGSARSGGALMINAAENKERGIQPSLQQRKAAGFIAGHCGWSDVSDLRESHYLFTVLRDPVARVVSFYDFCRNHVNVSDAPFFPIKASKDLSFEEFCRSDDPAVRMFVDNVQARTLATTYMDCTDRSAEGWERMATETLEALDFVAISEKLGQHLPLICDDIGISRPKRNVRRNVRSGGAEQQTPSLTEAREVLKERVAIDQKIYELGKEIAEKRCADRERARKV